MQDLPPGAMCLGAPSPLRDPRWAGGHQDPPTPALGHLQMWLHPCSRLLDALTQKQALSRHVCKEIPVVIILLALPFV